jgi:hypothetical protein
LFSSFLVAVLTVAWLVNGFDFYFGVPRNDGDLWRSVDTLPPTFVALQSVADAAVTWPFISLPIFLLMFGCNLWVLRAVWRPNANERGKLLVRLGVSLASLALPGMYLATVMHALSLFVDRLAC